MYNIQKETQKMRSKWSLFALRTDFVVPLTNPFIISYPLQSISLRARARSRTHKHPMRSKTTEEKRCTRTHTTKYCILHAFASRILYALETRKSTRLWSIIVYIVIEFIAISRNYYSHFLHLFFHINS